MQTSSAYSDPTLSSFSPELPRDVSCTLSPAETFPLIEDPSHGAVPDDILFPDGRSRQRLEVPDVITAHTWFFRRYRLNLYAALNTLLRSGELRMMTGFDFRNRVINRGCCGFPSVTFRDNGRSSFLAEVRADLDLDTGDRTRRWSGMLTLTFTAADGQFTGVMSDFQPLDQYTGRPNAPLSPFLIPYAKSADLDRLGEELWEQYLPEALTKPELRSGEALARAMGLTVRYEPLRDLPGTDSLIFFAPGELEAGKEGEAARTVRIPARTIVVNTSRIRPEHADYAIFH